MSVLLDERRGPVAILTLNRPERRNALNGELLGALRATFDELAHDDSVRAVVLTGAGDRAFSAGLDLAELAAGGGPGTKVANQRIDDDTPRADRSQLLPWDHPKPIVAALNGAAVAGGFEVMMACDLVVAAEHAVLGLAEVKRGLIPGGGGTLLATRIPLAVALEVTLTGDNLDARRAFELGLVNRVVPSGTEVEEAVVLAERIAANGPLAVSIVKRLVRNGATDGAATAWPRPSEMRDVFASEDAKEGARAFVEKRAPRWTGR